MKTCIYLRKSRADEELEKLGEGNTLNRHKDTLFKIANEKNLSIVKVHEEIVSGESLSQRPAMLELLKEVSDNLYDAVLVMDMDRLGRGNMQEQGLILDTFKQSKTKIITPRKTYDLEDEFDEEYSEFEAFMARKELKIITRRMQRGRLKSVEEGNYIGTFAPFGYKLEGQGRNRKLVIDPVNASAVRLIFERYASGKGGNHIADELNKLGYKTATGKAFYNHSILNIIKNPTYTGKLTWKKKEHKKGDLNKRRTVISKPREEWIITQGKHEPIISEELYNQALHQLKNKTHVPYKTKMTNPLAGLVFCSECHKPMIYRPYTKGKPHLLCYNKDCNTTKSSRFDYVEQDILEKLALYIEEFENEIPHIENSQNDYIEDGIKNINTEIEKLNKQKDSLHDFLEQGIYSVDTFLERNEIISSKLSALNKQLISLKSNIRPTNTKTEKISLIKSALEIYMLSDNVELKNQALKEIIDKIWYTKPKGSKPKDFQISITLLI